MKLVVELGVVRMIKLVVVAKVVLKVRVAYGA